MTNTANEGPWVAKARELGPVLAENAAKHDADGSFVDGSYALFRERGFFGMAVPAELGGGGASHADVCDAIRVLGQHCGSSALALSMHSHLVAASAWKHLRGKPAEALLRKVADGAALVSTGASDWVDSNGSMEKVDGGFLVTAKKIFGSGSPAADLMIASCRYDDPEEGPQVLHFPVPFRAEGVSIGDDWDTLGMRGTGSHTITLERVFVPDEAIALRRPRGEWHPAWTVALTVAVPIYMAAYVGIAEAAVAIATKAARRRRDAPHTPFAVGAMENELAAARMAWRAAIDNCAGYELEPVIETADRALVCKTLCTRAVVAAVELAMEASGGFGFFRRSGLERMLRDVHAAPFHPLPERKQQRFTGLLALGVDPITERERTEGP